MPTSTATLSPSPKLPLPVYQPSTTIPRYLLYDISHISYLRSQHAILGVLIGTLPQIPQQSVFLGLPLELQPEEAQLLVDKGIAYIVNDREWHDKDFRQHCGREREAIIEKLRDEGLEIAKGIRTMKKERTRLILQEQGRGRKEGKGNEKEKAEENRANTPASGAAGPKPPGEGGAQSDPSADAVGAENGKEEEAEETLFDSSSSAAPPRPPPPSSTTTTNSTSHPDAARSRSTSAHDPKPWAITPTTSTSLSISISKHRTPPLPSNEKTATSTTTTTTTTTPLIMKHSYPLFAHLHSRGYFLSPGLRFGCHFSVYPGDPLRFHSHFLANAYAWEEERELLEIVGGGRLGTGVKKGWLIGGLVEEGGGKEGGGEGEGEEEESGEGKAKGEGEEEVRCFCVEWGGM